MARLWGVFISILSSVAAARRNMKLELFFKTLLELDEQEEVVESKTSIKRTICLPTMSLYAFCQAYFDLVIFVTLMTVFCARPACCLLCCCSQDPDRVYRRALQRYHWLAWRKSEKRCSGEPKQQPRWIWDKWKSGLQSYWERRRTYIFMYRTPQFATSKRLHKAGAAEDLVECIALLQCVVFTVWAFRETWRTQIATWSRLVTRMNSVTSQTR